MKITDTIYIAKCKCGTLCSTKEILSLTRAHLHFEYTWRYLLVKETRWFLLCDRCDRLHKSMEFFKYSKLRLSKKPIDQYMYTSASAEWFKLPCNVAYGSMMGY